MEATLGPGRALPVPLTPLIGREKELAAACGALLEEGVRLLTLTGPPGVGKTRLALAAAAALAPAFPDGLWFVPLAAVPEATLVAGTVAAALGVPDTVDRALPERLAEALQDRRALLLLDNFEQVVEAAPLVAALRAACQGLCILVTSRRPLRLIGERELRLQPLAVPEPLGRDGLAAPAASPARDDATTERPAVALAPAVVLFLQRARDVRPDAVLTGQDAEAVAEICRRLDGLPLALELAAARLRHLTAPALLARLAPALPLLTDGPQDAPARHQTLRQTIAWSEALLVPAEQVLLRRLGVFAGGCTPEAVEAVAGQWPATGASGATGTSAGADTEVRSGGGVAAGVAPPEPQERRPAALERLGALVDHGLLQEDTRNGAAGAERFGLLETVREYALEQLLAGGEREATSRRHAAYFLGLAERAAAAMHGPDQGAWFDRLEWERGNLRAAIGWVLGQGDARRGVRFVEALRWFWEVRGDLGEGRRHVAALLALPALAAAADPGRRARALAVAAHLAHVQSDLAAAVALGAEGASLATAAGDRRARADALLWLARARDRLGSREGPGRLAGDGSGAPEVPGTSPAEARALLEESLALWREVGEPWGEAQALEWLGAVTRDGGDPRGARPSYAAALAQRRALGDRRGTAQTLGSLANMAARQGEYAAAIACAEESLATARALGDRARLASALSTLSLVAQAMGDAALAHRYLELQLAAAQQADAAPMIVLAAYRLAVLAAARGEEGLAAQLYLLALRRSVQRAIPQGTIACLAGLASVALARGLPEQAARLLGAAEAGRAGLVEFLAGVHLVQMQYEQTVAAVRRGLAGQPDLATWVEVGRLLPLEQLVAQAADLVEGDGKGGTTPPAGSPSPAAPALVPATGTPPPGARPLTAREQEVAVLVARGATNRQIAARLVIAERTAMRHVEHIFNKLGVHSRAEVGAWAARQGLDRPGGSM